MAEFKKLSEVEQIETASENATVLIEEEGEIKRVPKKEVGGAGGYIAVFTQNDYNNPAVNFNYGPVISENYDEMYDILSAGGNAWIDFTITNNMPEESSNSEVYPSAFGEMKELILSWMLTDIGLMASTWNFKWILFPNGSHNLEYVAPEPGGPM